MKIPTTILEQVTKLNILSSLPGQAHNDDPLASNEAEILQKQIVDVRASRDVGGTDEAIKEEEEEEEEGDDEDFKLPGHLERAADGNDSFDE